MENYIVLVTVNAAGQIAPSMVVFLLERIPRNLAESVPSLWGISRSKSGWMCAETFFEFISNVFNLWLMEREIPKPVNVNLFLDVHSSHLSLHVSTFCAMRRSFSYHCRGLWCIRIKHTFVSLLMCLHWSRLKPNGEMMYLRIWK